MRTCIAAVAATTAITLIAADLGSYPILMRPKESGLGSLGVYWYERSPTYRLGGNISKVLFTPLHWVDQKIRPTFWHGQIAIDTSDLNIPIRCGRHDEEAEHEQERPNQVPEPIAHVGPYQDNQ
jgi:hypothetical protein